MVDPVPEQVQYLEGKSKVEARNTLPASGVEVSTR
jgi:hypothetical protein